MTVARWQIRWPTLAGDSFSLWVRSCLPVVVWAAAMPALGADIPGCGTPRVGLTGAWHSQMGGEIRIAALCVSSGRGGRGSLRHFPRFVVGRGGRGMDGLSAEGRGTGRRNLSSRQL